MKTLITLLLLVAVTSCATQNNAQKRHTAYKKYGNRPACTIGTGCRR